jgi:hypothetical protein
VLEDELIDELVLTELEYVDDEFVGKVTVVFS